MKTKTVVTCSQCLILLTLALGLGQFIALGADVTGSPRAIIGINHDVHSTYSSVLGGDHNTNHAPYSVIAGGVANLIEDWCQHSAISGGYSNKILGYNAYASAIGGGIENIINESSHACVISGGYSNNIYGDSWTSSINGGTINTIGYSSPYAWIGGGSWNTIYTNGNYCSIGGGRNNFITCTSGDYADVTVSGGNGNRSWFSAFSTIAGGQDNLITNSPGTAIGGGGGNTIKNSSDLSTIAGGSYNLIYNSTKSTVSGGEYNGIGTNSSASTISGGHNNGIWPYSPNATICGGSGNVIFYNATNATIAGGEINYLKGNCSFAAGHYAYPQHDGCFVWSDYSTNSFLTTSGANQFRVGAAGGTWIFSNSGRSAGVSLAANGTAWAVISDRNAKKDFAPVDCRVILEKLGALPITRWHYKWEESDVPMHLGPTAQDFKAAFYPGTDDKSITTQEADGVTLAAIQALYRVVNEKDDQITSLQKRLAALENQLDDQKGVIGQLEALQQAVLKLTDKRISSSESGSSLANN